MDVLVVRVASLDIVLPCLCGFRTSRRVALTSHLFALFREIYIPFQSFSLVRASAQLRHRRHRAARPPSVAMFWPSSSSAQKGTFRCVQSQNDFRNFVSRQGAHLRSMARSLGRVMSRAFSRDFSLIRKGHHDATFTQTERLVM